MRSTKHYSLTLFAGVLVLAACTAPAPTTEPEQTPSLTPDPETTVAPDTVEPPENTFTPTVDQAGIAEIPSLDGWEDDEVEQGVQAGVDFALAGLTEPLFLSGEWEELEQDEVAELFSSSASAELQEVIADFDFNDPQHAHALASIAPVFRSNSSVTPLEECASTWRECLAQDVSFSNLSVSEDEHDSRLIVAFDVSTARFLWDAEGEAVYSGLDYSYNLWINEDMEVDAFDNEFTFGAVVDDLGQVSESE